MIVFREDKIYVDEERKCEVCGKKAQLFWKRITFNSRQERWLCRKCDTARSMTRLQR